MIPVNVRVICATHKNLLHEVDKGTFRQDLYYRLNVISLTIPPLRNRPQDIPLLFKHFIDKIAQDRGCMFQVAPEVIQRLQQVAWPGNVRELQNVVERATSLAASGVITLAHLPEEIYAAPPVFQQQAQSLFTVNLQGANVGRKQWQQLLGEAERQRMLLLLSKHGGNITVVAREMGVSRNTLYRKMRLYEIEN